MCQVTQRASLRSCLKQPSKSKSRSGNAHANKSTKTVTFKPKKAVRKIPTLAGFTKEDIEATWYSTLEVNSIMEMVNQLVIKAEESPEGATVRDIDGECLRGLERKTQDGHMEAFLARGAVYNAVLDEQDKQWANSASGDHYDLDKIAELCAQASSDSKLAALERAKQDEAVVQAYLYKEGPFLVEKEPELDLKQVFAKPSSASSKRRSIRVDDNWASWGTASTTSCDLDSDSEQSSSSIASTASTTTSTSTATSSASTAVAGKRSSFTTAKKISTPAVPRPNAPKKRLPNRAKNLSFQKSNEPAIRKTLGLAKTFPSTTPPTTAPTPAADAPTKKPVVKRRPRIGGLSLECSAIIQ